MGWPDMVGHLQDVSLEAFREDALSSYEPSDGQPPLSVRVVFHAPDSTLQLDDGSTVVSGQEPQAFVLGTELAPWIPARGDHVTIAGTRYLVAGGVDQPGGRGLYRLPLFKEPVD